MVEDKRPRPIQEVTSQQFQKAAANDIDITIIPLSDRSKIPSDRPALVVRESVPGSIPNGTIVVKVQSDSTDAHPNGSRAKILGSVGPVEYEGHGVTYGYFVEWEDTPIPTFIAGFRIRPVDQKETS